MSDKTNTIHDNDNIRDNVLGLYTSSGDKYLQYTIVLYIMGLWGKFRQI